MGSIISSGVGSGLDIAGLVQKLVEAEAGPKTLRLNREEAKVQAKLSALGTLRSALAGFRDTAAVLKDIDKFRGRQVTLSAKDFLSATADTDAGTGTYSVHVQQLARAHKLQSTTFLATTTVVGTGTLTIATGDETYHVVIDSTNNTVAGIAAAINASAAAAGVSATVISGDGDVRLTLSARATGEDNALTITQAGGNGGLATLVYPPAGGMEEIQEALDAEALIDGVLATSSTNTLSGAIGGVDLVLKAENEPLETTDVTIAFNRDAARKTIDDLVKSYNAVVDAVKNVASYNAETRQGGPLFGDAGVRNLVSQLRRELTSSVTGLQGPFDLLNEIGVSAELDGKLKVDATRLDAAFAANFDAVGELFAADGTGLAAKLESLLDPYLQTGGVFDSRTANLKSSIADIGDRRATLNLRLEALQTRYLKQFNALDGLLAQLQGTSNFLTQQLKQLPGISLFNKD